MQYGHIKKMCTCKFLLLILFIQMIAAQRISSLLFQYKPATFSNARETVEKNLQQYKKIIENYKDEWEFDMVILPEYGLTGILNSTEDIHKYSDLTNFVLKRLSSIAKEHHIYIIVNLIEKIESFYYNTNFVITNKGRFILKSRKTNLDSKEKFTLNLSEATKNNNRIFATEELGNFLVLNGNDLKVGLTEEELHQIKDGKQMNIICPSAIQSEYPFEIASSIYQSFAVSSSLHLLVSQLESTPLQEAGVYTVQKEVVKELFVKNEENIKAFGYHFWTNEYKSSCLNLKFEPTLYMKHELHDEFNKSQIQHFHSRSYNVSNKLPLEEFEVHQYIARDNFVCTISLKLKERDLYKDFILVAEKSNDTIICALLACNITENCSRPTTTKTLFKFIEIGFSDSYNETEQYFYRPIGLTEHFKPIENINYCPISIKNVTNSIRVSAVTLSKVLTMGIVGYKVNTKTTKNMNMTMRLYDSNNDMNSQKSITESSSMSFYVNKCKISNSILKALFIYMLWNLI